MSDREQPRERDPDQWRELWGSFLKRELSAEQIVEMGLMQAAAETKENVTEKLRVVVTDLVALTQAGANPRIVVQILFARGDHRVLPEDFGDDFFDRDAELAQLTSPRYWTRILRRLEAARGTLRGFMDTGAYHRIAVNRSWELEADIRPFSRICHEVQGVDSAMTVLMRSIRELRLDRADTALKDDGLAVSIENTSGQRGRKKRSGVPRASDRATLGLDCYLRIRAGGPHTRVVARLLHVAELDEFPGVMESDRVGDSSERTKVEETDRLNKRIRYLNGDSDLLASVRLGLSLAESKYETREPMDFGGGIFEEF